MSLAKHLLHQIEDVKLTASERAEMRCELAKDFAESGNYEAARESMGDLWQRVGDRPVTEGLKDETKPEVLLRVGALTSSIGSANQVEGAQELAKNLISEGIGFFGRQKRLNKIAEAQTELAVCYWREGSFDEARVILQDALSDPTKLDDETRARALLRSAIIEESARRYHDALRLQMEAAPLFERSHNLALRGKFHHLFGFILRKLAEADQRLDYIDRALIEYAAASYYFEEAQLKRHQACVENNLGFLFGTINKFPEAHEHLDRAQMLFTRLKDDVHLAQVDETRARVMLAEGRVVEAEKTVRAAVRTLEKGDEQSLLAEALTTHGIAQARLQHPEQAKVTLERAVEVAERAGDLESAGNASLVLIEELGSHLPNDELKAIVDRARELLANTQDLSTLKRLAISATRVLSIVNNTPRFPAAVDWTNFSFKDKLLEYEAHLINLALEDAGGVVSRAARLLGFNHHQSLLVLLNGRHKILRQRDTPIVPRRRSIIRSRSTNGTRTGKRRGKRKINILLVENNASVAQLVQKSLQMQGLETDVCADVTAAKEKIGNTMNHYDLLLLDHDLPGLSGDQLAQLARSLPHHLKTPIIILSETFDQESAQRSGADAFLRKPEGINMIGETVTRLLKSARV
jgi:CheY-like chemotaxis protein